MFSKLLRPSYRLAQDVLLLRQMSPKTVVARRGSGGLIPPSQYDIPFPKKLQLGHVLRVYWETIPLFVCVAFSILLVFASFAYCCMYKPEIVFTTHSRRSLCRTMDLRNPITCKIITINQRYEPWPEMQDVLDKMKAAEKRALVRVTTCSLV